METTLAKEQSYGTRWQGPAGSEAAQKCTQTSAQEGNSQGQQSVGGAEQCDPQEKQGEGAEDKSKDAAAEVTDPQGPNGSQGATDSINARSSPHPRRTASSEVLKAKWKLTHGRQLEYWRRRLEGFKHQLANLNHQLRRWDIAPLRKEHDKIARQLAVLRRHHARRLKAQKLIEKKLGKIAGEVAHVGERLRLGNALLGSELDLQNYAKQLRRRQATLRTRRMRQKRKAVRLGLQRL